MRALFRNILFLVSLLNWFSNIVLILIAYEKTKAYINPNLKLTLFNLTVVNGYW